MYLCIYIRFEQVSIVVLLYLLDEFRTGNLETAELVRHHAPVSMVAPQRRIPPGAMVMPPDWGTQCIPRWRLQMLRPTESLLKQLCCLRQGLQSKEVGDGNPKKEFSKWKGHSTLASFDSCFHFGDFDYWPTPFFSFHQRLPLNYNEILWGVWGWHHLNNIQQVMFPAFCHPKIL